MSKSQGLLEMPFICCEANRLQGHSFLRYTKPMSKSQGHGHISVMYWLNYGLPNCCVYIYILYMYVNVCLPLGCQLTVVRNVWGLQILVWQDKQFPKYWQSSPICIHTNTCKWWSSIWSIRTSYLTQPTNFHLRKTRRTNYIAHI